MPVRSLSSPVLRWPDREAVERGLREWVTVEARRHPHLRRLGYFGSYARGDWGVGSDLDLVAVVAQTREEFERRAVSWSTEALPVPAQILVYTTDEWDRMQREGGRLRTHAGRRDGVGFRQRGGRLRPRTEAD